MKPSKISQWTVLTMMALPLAFGTGGAVAQTTIPTLSDVLTEAFERGTLEDWVIATGSVLALDPGQGPTGTTALQVTVSQAESHLVRGGRRDLARADEAYLTFQFDPNSLSYSDPGAGFIPGRSIQIAAIKGPGFKNMVAIRFRDTGGAYEAFLEWRDEADTGQFDFATGSFPLADAWQEITIGFGNDGWVACWINGSLVRSVAGVDHLEPYASVIEIGKTLTNTLINPSGTIRFDDVQFAVPRIDDLWVDAAAGSDSNDGLTPGTALASITRSSDLAAAGSTVHIMPGTYRETVLPAQGGEDGAPVVFRAENGAGTVHMRGSERSATLAWTQLASDTIGLPPGVAPSNIWWADLSSWALAASPLFVVRTGAGNEVVERLPVAREPDWSVATAWKPSEFWWAANGGGSVAPCTPSPGDRDCDQASRSTLQLTDTANDASPAGVEPGNLTTLGNLTGAVIVARDTVRGHFHYRRSIVSHSVGSGRVTVDQPCTRSDGDAGLGWGSKYYVEAHPALLDQSGEWWFDTTTGRLYLWPPSPGDPASQNLEISRYGIGFDLKNLSYVTLQDLDLELYNAAVIENDNFIWHKSLGNRVAGCLLQYANVGIDLFHQIDIGEHVDKRIEGTVFENNEIAHMETQSIKLSYIWDSGSDPNLWERPGVTDTRIVGNTIHDIGFRSEPNADSTGSLVSRHSDKLRIENNTLSDIAMDGMLILDSVIQSPATWGFDPAEIVVGEILVRGNLIERACAMKNDCGAIRVRGLAPDRHVMRDFLAMENRFYDNTGFSSAAEARGINSDGQLPGAGGNGIYMDNTSGLHAYRNRLYSNGLSGFFLIKTWRDGQMIMYNNVVADNTFGFIFGGLAQDTDHVNVDTRVRNNAMVNNEAYAIRLEDADADFTNTLIDRNLYWLNGWGSVLVNPGILTVVNNVGQTPFPTLVDVQAGTPFEAAGQEGDPSFVDYDETDHQLFDGSRPDFRLLTGSIAVNAGTTGLPASLDTLLGLFGITETRIGARWDQGFAEGEVVAVPSPIFSDGFESGDTSAWSQTVQ